MKSAIEKEFVRCGRKRQWMYQTDQIALRPREYNAHAGSIDGAVSMVFDIIDTASRKSAGEIALRIGDGPSLFYLGHVGYHIDPPYRGRHYALMACRLCLPIFEAFHFNSWVITTDDDNAASIRTCEELPCTLESVVSVPMGYMDAFRLSDRKRRYVYTRVG